MDLKINDVISVTLKFCNKKVGIFMLDFVQCCHVLSVWVPDCTDSDATLLNSTLR